MMTSLPSICCQGIMGMMQGMISGPWFGIMIWAFVLGFASGIVVFLGAIMISVRPEKRRT